MPPIITNPCETRPIRFLELWQPDDWRMKVYGIAYGRPAPRGELIEAAKDIAADDTGDEGRHDSALFGRLRWCSRWPHGQFCVCRLVGR